MHYRYGKMAYLVMYVVGHRLIKTHLKLVAFSNQVIIIAETKNEQQQTSNCRLKKVAGNGGVSVVAVSNDARLIARRIRPHVGQRRQQRLRKSYNIKQSIGG